MKSLQINRLPDLPFDVSEAINQLRVNLSFTGSDMKVIMVTSTLPNEGKSFVAFNLWRSLAGIGKRVLHIDCDLRMSEMRSVLDYSVAGDFVGIAHLLSGQADIPDVVYKTNVPNGYMLPVTTAVADPTILFESERFRVLLEHCRETFDYVIVDTPPLGNVSDALNISKNCDGTVLVVRSGFTKKRFVNESVQSLKRAGSPLLGIVLNRVDTSKKSGSYYYKDYYKYGAEYYKGGKKDRKK